MKRHCALTRTVFFCVSILSALGCTVISSFDGIGLPVYEMGQVPSEHAGYHRTTLTYDSIVYVNDYEESALVTFGDLPTERIGRFRFSLDGVSGVYAIPGQDPSAYALEYDPMYQSVYRNINHPPFDWRAADFHMMRLYLPQNPKEITDFQIIEDILSALKADTAMAVPFQADGNYAGYQNYTMMSFSDTLPGLGYSFAVHLAPDGKVYLAENLASNQWFLAGQQFSDWMKTNE